LKVLISGPKFHEYNNSIGRAFGELGHKVELSEWPTLGGNILYRAKLLLFEKLKKPFDHELQKFLLEQQKNVILQYNKKLLYEAEEIKPDILLVLKGDIIFPKTIKKIKERIETISVMWCYDKAVRYPNVIKGGEYYNLFYTFEPSDKKELQKYGIESQYLPMAYDPFFYYKKENSVPTIDISFVGAMYPNRKKILEMLTHNIKNLRIDYWGKAWTWCNPFLLYEYKIKRRTLGKHIHNVNISHKKINDIYNSTKICLNIHHPQSKEGVNPRTFEIPGAGSFQLTDYKKSLENLFEADREIVYYKNENDLLEKISYYLENEDERKRIAKRGNEIAGKKHTFRHRAETILTDIERIS